MKTLFVLALVACAGPALAGSAREEGCDPDNRKDMIPWLENIRATNMKAYSFLEQDPAAKPLYAELGKNVAGCHAINFPFSYFHRSGECVDACMLLHKADVKLAERCKSTPEAELFKDTTLYTACMDLFIKDKKVTAETCKDEAARKAEPRMELVCKRLAAQGGDEKAQAAERAELKRRVAGTLAGAEGEAQSFAIAERPKIEMRPLLPVDAIGPRGWGAVHAEDAPRYETALTRIENPVAQQALQRAISYGPLLGDSLVKAQAGCDQKMDRAGCLRGVETKYAGLVANGFKTKGAAPLSEDERIAFIQTCQSMRANAGPKDDPVDRVVRDSCDAAFKKPGRGATTIPSPATSQYAGVQARAKAMGCGPNQLFLRTGTIEHCPARFTAGQCECRNPFDFK